MKKKPKELMKKRTILLINIFGILLMVLMIGLIIGNVLSTAKYQRVEAEIIKIESQVRPSNNSATYSLTYEFTFEGKEYQIVRRGLRSTDKKEGDKEYLRCNPDNPEEIASNVWIVISSLVLGFTALFILYFNLRKRKRYMKLYYTKKELALEKEKLKSDTEI